MYSIRESQPKPIMVKIINFICQLNFICLLNFTVIIFSRNIRYCHIYKISLVLENLVEEVEFLIMFLRKTGFKELVVLKELPNYLFSFSP